MTCFEECSNFGRTQHLDLRAYVLTVTKLDETVVARGLKTIPSGGRETITILVSPLATRRSHIYRKGLLIYSLFLYQLENKLFLVISVCPPSAYIRATAHNEYINNYTLE